MQRKIGLTGGIATGKSTVAAHLAMHHHLPVLDADVYARQAVAVGSPVLAAIAQRFGAEMLRADGSLDRGRLGDLVFRDRAQRRWLEDQIHPVVRHCFDQALADLRDAPTVVLMIPLLFEAELTDWVSEIWVVACEPEQQRSRLIERDRLTPAQAEQRIHSQMPLGDKVAAADVVIQNTGSVSELQAQVNAALVHQPVPKFP